MAACPETKINLYLEAPKTPIKMKREKFFTEIGATASCAMRATVGAMHCGLDSRARREALERGRKHLVIADSWFGGVKYAEN